MPQFNVTLMYVFVSVVVIQIIMNYVFIHKKNVVIMTYFYMKNKHILNVIKGDVYKVVKMKLNINSILNRIYKIIIKYGKLSRVLIKIKMIKKKSIYQIYGNEKNEMVMVYSWNEK